MSEKAFGDDFYGYEGMSAEEMNKRMWDEDGPPTLEDENLTWTCKDGRVTLMGRGGFLQDFNPDPDLDAALLAALEAAS